MRLLFLHFHRVPIDDGSMSWAANWLRSRTKDSRHQYRRCYGLAGGGGEYNTSSAHLKVFNPTHVFLLCLFLFAVPSPLLSLSFSRGRPLETFTLSSCLTFVFVFSASKKSASIFEETRADPYPHLLTTKLTTRVVTSELLKQEASRNKDVTT